MASRRPRVRRTALVVVLWMFGVATSTVLVGIWGRTVAGDPSTLEAGAHAALGESIIADRVNGWIADEIGGAEAIDLGLVEPAVRDVMRSPEAREALDLLIAETVDAALAPPGSPVEIDVESALRPLAPLIAEQFALHGIPIGPAEIDAILERIGSLLLSTEEELGVTATVGRGRVILTTVLVVGSVALTILGALAVLLSDDRARMVRSLAHRLVLSSLTFAVLLRIGAWAVDPAGGRSPAARAGAVLLSSHGFVPLGVAVGAGLVSMAATIVVRRRRTAPDPSPSRPSEEPVPAAR